jgi:putative IMPACT (imprinted ancient) family translation regulator
VAEVGREREKAEAVRKKAEAVRKKAEAVRKKAGAEVLLKKRSQHDCFEEAHYWQMKMEMEVEVEHWTPQELSCWAQVPHWE